MSLPLEGIRVLDLSHVIAGPMASFYLAQLGAEVIKIESPLGGDVMRSPKTAHDTDAGDTPSAFTALNAGKRSFAVDIRTPEGAAQVRALARTADVFIENFRPGVVARHGLDEAAIRAEQPDIVYCSISAYGQQGEWSGRAGYDHVVQALTGMMMMSGDDDAAPPLKVGFPVIDVAAGMLGALSVVAALFRRTRGGQGARIDTSMVQASLMLMYPNASAYMTHRVPTQRVGNRGYTGSPAADTYPCADGWLATAANTPAQFRKLTRVLGLEALCQDGEAIDLAAFNAPGGGFVVARDQAGVRRRLREAFATRSAADMEAQLNAVGVAAARVRRLGEFLDEVEGGQRASLAPRSYGEPGRGGTRTPGLGFRFVGESLERPAGAPHLGEANEALRVQLQAGAGAATAPPS